MFSTDDTEEVCSKYPNVHFHRRQDYIYGNVNFGFEQATSDWVIRIDSDEVLNCELQDSIQKIVANAPDDVVGCWFPSVQYMFGRPMRYGPGFGGPPRRMMFRRGLGYYPCVSEHEDFEMRRDGKWVTLDGYYEHFTNATVREIVTKYVYYAEKDALRKDWSNYQPTSPMRLLWQGLRLFWRFYWTLNGRKEGVFGFYASLMRGPVQHWIVNAELWTKHQEVIAKNSTAHSE